jgi:hypothetical protein
VTDEDDALRVFEVLECAGRAVSAERFHQRRRRCGRAETRVGVDRGDTQAGARDLAERVVLLEQQLTAVVNPDSIRSFGGERLIEAIDQEVHRIVPRRANELAGSVANEWMRRATRVAVREVLIQAFRPEAAVVHGMSSPSAYAHDAFAGDTDFHAAAY